ncbi:hypothetical protein QTG54_012781 [Skeletonema marinoi]|uniref:Uncharacterized protein n=1 Tax=Skeletonema marinoi TaxID=267567 RepID=A0AAD8XZZ1_9STRA|nr:hypothetical protein QTG54_012781 [Skeletonema marinoi]
MEPRTAMEKELLKESLYKNRVQEILRKHKGFLSSSYNEDVANEGDDIELLKKQYSSERKIIDGIISNERSAFLSGLALSGVVFASVRFGPRYLAVKLGGIEKARALKEADDAARKAGTRWIQQGVSFLFEASFGAWAGYRGYNMISSQNSNSYDEIAKIPLCAGKSIVSEKICSEWVDLVHNEMSKDFWKNLDEEDCRLKDKGRWKAVLGFADNCIKRKAFEDSYRKQHGMKSDDPVDVPKGGVPTDILQMLRKQRSS